MTTKYKIWIQIEKCDDENDEYENVSEPENLFESDSLNTCENVVEKLMDIQGILFLNQK